MAVERSRSGAPDSPPASPLCGERSVSGRAMVVLLMISPLTPLAQHASTIGPSASSARSGASFTSTGLPSSRGATAARMPSSRASPWRSRSPGVLGEETLMVT